MKINIIYSNNSFGLTKDAKIIRSILSEHKFNLIDFKKNNNLHKADLNIFLEVLDRNDGYFKNYKKLAPKNILFPNPEWFMDSWVKYIKELDLICCKTKHAVKIFSQYTDKIMFTSFTSENLDLKYIQKEKSFFHSGGKSVNKGTDRLIEAWLGIKEKLYLYHRNYKTKNPNIELSNEYIQERDFQEIRNKILYHIYPTKYEGFGQNIWESLSCGAIIITTDSPPMNEFNCDFYVKAIQSRKHCQAHFWNADINDIRLKVNQASKLSNKEIIERISKNKETFKINDLLFKKKLKECIKTL
jgi:hypothetical protein